MEIAETMGSTGLRCSQVLYPSQSQAIDKVLSNLVRMIPAQYILLADNSGHTLSASGELDHADPIVLGALVASDMAASQEMDRLIGKSQNLNMILREGADVNTWIVNAGPNLVLMSVISADVPLGWTRLMIHRGIRLIADIADAPSQDFPTEFSLEIDAADLGAEIDNNLEELWCA